jgi:LDH2 family malate/lactate/ureidoglycolate dehydrogenase
MLPAAGAKGFALGLMVELFSAVLGAGAIAGDVGSVFDTRSEVRVSHSIVAIRPFDGDYGHRAAELLAQVDRLNHGSDVRIPGAEREKAAVMAHAAGIDLPDDSLQSLRRAADMTRVRLPPGLSAGG